MNMVEPTFDEKQLSRKFRKMRFRSLNNLARYPSWQNKWRMREDADRVLARWYGRHRNEDEQQAATRRDKAHASYLNRVGWEFVNEYFNPLHHLISVPTVSNLRDALVCYMRNPLHLEIRWPEDASWFEQVVQCWEQTEKQMTASMVRDVLACVSQWKEGEQLPDPYCGPSGDLHRQVILQAFAASLIREAIATAARQELDEATPQAVSTARVGRL